jgi:hypothetical protein
MIGWIKDSGGTYQTALMFLGALMFVIVPLATVLRHSNGPLVSNEAASAVGLPEAQDSVCALGNRVDCMRG